MTRLEAVNLILGEMGLAPALALDTSGTTDVAEAENYLNIHLASILQRGWACNVDHGISIKPTTDTVVITGGNGLPFDLGEMVSESVSGVTGTVCAVRTVGVTTTLCLARSGLSAFTGGQTLTGLSSNATRAGGAASALTAGEILVGTDWLSVRQAYAEERRLTQRGDRMYDETERTFKFTGPAVLTVTRLLAFETLPYALARHVAMTAALNFQRYKKRSVTDESLIAQAANDARNEAEREDSLARRLNTRDTPEARSLRGRRRGYGSSGESEMYVE